ncbi:MAG: SHOCT domain-containing protein [candidate division KSB1 bacterium]|nr:SHOCT domain-containing protein [candidate division KSB1 bacterium]
MHGYGTGFMGWGWILGLVVLGLIIWAVVRSAQNSNTSPREPKSALDILKERYALGEIDKQEFEEKKRDLTG